MSEPKLDQTCHGPIHLETGICQWCGNHHETVTAGQTCCAKWPDRPRKDVNPQFGETRTKLMRFKCWKCDAENVFNSIMTPGLFTLIANGGTLHAHCNKCGSGIDVKQSVILNAAQSRAVLSQGMNRHQRRATVVQKRRN